MYISFHAIFRIEIKSLKLDKMKEYNKKVAVMKELRALKKEKEPKETRKFCKDARTQTGKH